MYSAIDLSYAKKAGQCLTGHHSQPANNNFTAILYAKLCVLVRARYMCTNWIWVHALSFAFSPAQFFVTALAKVWMKPIVISGHVQVWSLNINVSINFWSNWLKDVIRIKDLPFDTCTAWVSWFVYVRVTSRNRTLGTVCLFPSTRGFRLTSLLHLRVASLKKIRASSIEKSSVEPYSPL